VSGRNRVRATRDPRRREAPQEDSAWWELASHFLAVRSGGYCERGCGRNLVGTAVRAERHHRLRRREGGDRLANLLLLCSLCHRHDTEHPAEALANGWSVPAETDPASVAVRLANGRLYLLDDSGGRHLVP
jgi:hypothetical protein